MIRSAQPPQVCIVDDSSDDRYLLEVSLRRQNCKGLNIAFFPGGEELIHYLEAERDRGHHGRFLLVLDLKMPRLDGLEILALLKKDDTLKCNPTVIFSSSRLADDIQKAYLAGANAFVQKPMTLDEYSEFADDLVRFWCKRNLFHGIC